MKIEVTKEQYKAFQNGESITLVPPNKEYVIEYKDNNISDSYSVVYSDRFETISYSQLEPSKKFISHGRYRRTKRNAEYSLKRNQRANRLEALVEDLQGELGVGNYSVVLNNMTYWYVTISDQTETYQTIGVVTMKKETAEKVCELLNSGQYSLEGL